MKYIKTFVVALLLNNLCSIECSAMEDEKKTEAEPYFFSFKYYKVGAGKTEYDKLKTDIEKLPEAETNIPLDYKGITPFLLVAIYDDQPLAERLIEKKANIHQTDRAKNNALHMAINHKHFELAAYLVSKGVQDSPNNKGIKPTERFDAHAGVVPYPIRKEDQKKLARIKKLIKNRDNPKKPKCPWFRCRSSKSS
jgi:hypothetical protein